MFMYLGMYVTYMLITDLSMVQEKVLSSRPSVPQRSARGGTSMPKLKTHTATIISAMFVRE